MESLLLVSGFDSSIESFNLFLNIIFTEAVNLELVNLHKPKNGAGHTSLPTKKDTEVHIGDPYDEYFVPVNEHRKYMRYTKSRMIRFRPRNY